MSTSMAESFKSIFDRDAVDRIGKETGFCQRLRTITPYRLLVTLISAMVGGAMCAIADIVRRFNHEHDTEVYYKPFYKRLAHRALPHFLRRMVTEMMQRLTAQILRPDASSPLAQFTDIILQDGTSFHIKATTPRNVFGGLSGKEPAVRLHASMSLFNDAVDRVVLTGNRVGETKRRVDPEYLTGKLYLADRAYASVDIFERLLKHNASFVIRLSKTFNPEVVAIYDPKRGRLPMVRRRYRRFNDFVAQLNPKCADLEVNMGTKDKPLIMRVVVLPSKEDHGTRLCTNLSHTEFSAEQVGDVYRLRWQIELLFKEWKSFTNMHRFDTQNPHIIESLVWAALAAAIVVRCISAEASKRSRVVLSTQTAAKSASVWLVKLMVTAARAPSRLRRALHEAVRYLEKNARRANMPRDRKTGRYRSLDPIPVT